MTKEVFNTDLNSLSPYILGKKYFGKAKNVTRGNPEILSKFLTLLEADPIAKEFFNAYNISSDFYNTMIDFKHFIPKEHRDEVFYAAKVGKMYREVPAFCVYILEKAWEQCNGMPNLLFKVIPIQAIKKFCEEDYFLGGLSLRDVICNICCEDYSPVSFYSPKNKVGNFTELYIPSADMVAAVPNSIADCLDDNSVTQIVLGTNGLEIHGKLLRTMANHVGAINSTYDLRELL